MPDPAVQTAAQPPPPQPPPPRTHQQTQASSPTNGAAAAHTNELPPPTPEEKRETCKKNSDSTKKPAATRVRKRLALPRSLSPQKPKRTVEQEKVLRQLTNVDTFPVAIQYALSNPAHWEGWVQLVDTNGRVYYANADRGATQWNQPENWLSFVPPPGSKENVFLSPSSLLSVAACMEQEHSRADHERNPRNQIVGVAAASASTAAGVGASLLAAARATEQEDCSALQNRTPPSNLLFAVGSHQGSSCNEKPSASTGLESKTTNENSKIGAGTAAAAVPSNSDSENGGAALLDDHDNDDSRGDFAVVDNERDKDNDPNGKKRPPKKYAKKRKSPPKPDDDDSRGDVAVVDNERDKDNDPNEKKPPRKKYKKKRKSPPKPNDDDSRGDVAVVDNERDKDNDPNEKKRPPKKYKKKRKSPPKPDTNSTEGDTNNTEENSRSAQERWRANMMVRHEKNFDETIEELKAYKAQHGDFNLPSKNSEAYRNAPESTRKLRHKLDHLKHTCELLKRGEQSSLSLQRIMQLNEVGINLFAKKRKLNVTWEQRMEQCRAFIAEHGHLRIPPNHEQMGCWCSRIRKEYRRKVQGKKATLTDERQKQLEELGFVFLAEKATDEKQSSPKPRRSWDQWLEEFIEWKRVHGHPFVPQQLGGLGHWVATQRQAYRYMQEGRKYPKYNMTVEKALKLSNAGFAWVASSNRRTPWTEQPGEMENPPCYAKLTLAAAKEKTM